MSLCAHPDQKSPDVLTLELNISTLLVSDPECNMIHLKDVCSGRKWNTFLRSYLLNWTYSHSDVITVSENYHINEQIQQDES